MKIENVRHSLAHLLAAAVLEEFPKAKLGIGPVIENGFYYDFQLPRSLTREDLAKFEGRMREFVKMGYIFSGKKITPAEARKIFKHQSLKLDLIKEFVKEKKGLSIYYTCPPTVKGQLSKVNCFVDLCRGGHVKNTEEIKPDAFKLTKIAGAYWRGDEKNPQLQRVYGVAFNSKKELDDYIKLQEEIERRDHRKLGERLDLFSFHDIAPGAPFWHGKGMIIFRELEKLIRQELDSTGYEEISTPIMVKKELFEKSGHWEYYRENMFYWKQNNETFVLKPMNCPESTYVYGSKIRSYKDLPLRLAEIGRLHRNELSGALGGLLRVRQITMDDAHIYCRPDQIQSEISFLLKLVNKVYDIFSFERKFYLATKPDNALGDVKLWRKAEKALKLALRENSVDFDVKPKDGAFYGPKIDIHIRDAIGRDWQLATIQLDLMMLPEKFNLYYIDEKGKKQKPVIIHRAIFGSFERFIAVLLEHYAGALPFWLSPVQIKIVPVADRHSTYAQKAAEQLKNFRVEVADENETVGKKIRNAELEKIPYVLVVGDTEEKNKTVRVRERQKGDVGEMKLSDFIKKLSPRA